jgi:hypothetical protein
MVFVIAGLVGDAFREGSAADEVFTSDVGLAAVAFSVHIWLLLPLQSNS